MVWCRMPQNPLQPLNDMVMRSSLPQEETAILGQGENLSLKAVKCPIEAFTIFYRHVDIESRDQRVHSVLRDDGLLSTHYSEEMYDLMIPWLVRFPIDISCVFVNLMVPLFKDTS